MLAVHIHIRTYIHDEMQDELLIHNIAGDRWLMWKYVWLLYIYFQKKLFLEVENTFKYVYGYWLTFKYTYAPNTLEHSP